MSLYSPGLGYEQTEPLRCPVGNLHIAVRDGEWLEGWGCDGGPVCTGDLTDASLHWKGKGILILVSVSESNA